MKENYPQKERPRFLYVNLCPSSQRGTGALESSLKQSRKIKIDHIKTAPVTARPSPLFFPYAEFL